MQQSHKLASIIAFLFQNTEEKGNKNVVKMTKNTSKFSINESNGGLEDEGF